MSDFLRVPATAPASAVLDTAHLGDIQGPKAHRCENVR